MKKTATLSFVILILLLFQEEKIFARSAEVPYGEMCWWYDKPASKYWEGLPVATGRFAAMIPGKIRKDEIWLNEETLWSGGPYNPNNPEGPK